MNTNVKYVTTVAVVCYHNGMRDVNVTVVNLVKLLITFNLQLKIVRHKQKIGLLFDHYNFYHRTSACMKLVFKKVTYNESDVR